MFICSLTFSVTQKSYTAFSFNHLHRYSVIYINGSIQKYRSELTATGVKGNGVTSQSHLNTLVGFIKVKQYC